MQAQGAGVRAVEAALDTEYDRATQFCLKYGFAKVGETRFQIDDQSYPNHVPRYDLA
ncbi:hypothetical protein [Aminobacter sp. AP02]|uniref:hypothetical protein n=1 Tax=Aminobacter sp. AP02 TaxID=2135737 RepID=UPI000D7A9E54|nr:hypothetical protein [Aminobacter sp. AP02]PWK75669.1 hypothetical protein C8K44_103237 [Aminobacter sp. AP02]